MSKRTNRELRYVTIKHIANDRKPVLTREERFKAENEKLTKKIKIILDT